MMQQISTNRFRGAPADRRGGALVVSVAAVMTVAAMSAAFLQLSNSITKRQTHSADLKRAMYLAEAGLAEAYVGIGMAKTGNVGTEAEPAGFGEGLFWVEAIDKGGDLIELESTALAGSARISLGMVVERAEISVGSLGIYATQDLTVESGSLIDSYNSSQGTYAEQVLSGDNNSESSVGSSGSVTLDGSRGAVEVRGDAVPGMTETVTQNGTVTVSGSTAPRSSAVVLPAPEAPAPKMNAGVAHVSPVPLVIPSGTRGVESLAIGPGATVVVVGPASIVAGGINMATGASIQFDVSDGPIDFFVTGDMTVADGAALENLAQDPTQLSLQMASTRAGTYGDLSLGSNITFHGSLYAPSSAVTLGAGSQVFGSIVADSLGLAQGAQLHYDLAIVDGDTSLPRLSNWRVVEVPGPLAAKGADPFKALGIDPSACKKPSAAHEDQWLDVDYLDGSGSPAIYSGWEKDFDWADVSEVKDGSRDGELMTDAKTEEIVKTDPPMATPDGTPNDWITDPDIGSSELTHYLIEASPLGDVELNAAVARTPLLEPNDLFEVLLVNSPMGTATLQGAIVEDRLDDGLLYELVQVNSPVGDTVLTSIIDLPKIQDAVLRQILIEHSPLSGAVLTALDGRSVQMNPSDREMVSAVQ